MDHDVDYSTQQQPFLHNGGTHHVECESQPKY